MRKRHQQWMLTIILICSLMTFNSCTVEDNPVQPAAPKQYATLKEALDDVGCFSKIKENPDEAAMKRKERGELDYKEQYSMFIKQDVNHNQPGADTFEQKVCILFRGFDRPTIMVTGGYMWLGFGDMQDLGTNLNANMVFVEHRNFGESYNKDYGKWEYETTAQVSADLHAVYQALKPAFKGKWMSAGTSKSGETSMGYAYYYPGDMNLAAAFCSPFNLSLTDERYGHYLFNEVSTKENRELMKTGISRALQGGETGTVYKAVCLELEKDKDRALPFTEYVYHLFDTFFQVFQNVPPSYQGEVLKELAADDNELTDRIYRTVYENRSEAYYTYLVDVVKEQGLPSNGYEYFDDLLKGTSFDRNNIIQLLLKEEDRKLVTNYSNSLCTDMLNNFFVNSTIPLLFFYSHDDPWAASQPEKLGPNAKKVINPIGTHSSALNDPFSCPADTKQEVMNFVSTYIY